MTINSFIFAVSLLLLLNGFTFCLYTKDKFALLTIKTNIIDHSGILSNNWSATSNASICTWIGISCDLNNQFVIALNLSGMGLAGTVTPLIGNLSYLTSLDISYNNFSGSVPEELSHLHHLQYLRLSNNNFTGTIQASLGNITKLEILNLGFNQLTGSIPAAIFNISSLRAIHLSANNLYGSLPVDICSQYVPKLKRIFLSMNHFEGKIPPSLFKCRELQHLELSVNEFSGSIPIEISNLTMLKNLWLGNNNLEGMVPLYHIKEHTRSQQIGDPNILPIILGTRNHDQSPAGGGTQYQLAGGTKNVNYGVGQTRAHTHKITPFNSNYHDMEVTSLSELKELACLRLEIEVLMEMLKEKITANGHQALRVGLQKGGSIPRSIAEESSRNRVDAKIPNLSTKTLAMVDGGEGGDEDDDGDGDDGMD
ncbi:hypothetical protein LguiB_018010 [Lonicera macranthoides]